MTTTSNPNPLTTQRGGAPLTTVFTTPDFCNSAYWTDTLTPPLSSVVCMPTSWHQVFDYGWGFYSPAICPSGYTEGCAFPTSLASKGADGNVGLGGPVIAGETPRLCCPTGHTCYSDTTSFAYSKCISTQPTTTYHDINNKLTSRLALVFAVQVRWQQSDLSILQTNPTVPGATYTAPATAGSGTSATAKATATGSAPTASGSPTTALSDSGSFSGDDGGGGGGGISVGTTVGIAVGSVVGTLVLAFVGFMLWWRRRRRREAGDNRDHRDHDDGGDAKSDTMALAHKASLLDVMSPSTAGRPGTGTTVFGDAPHSPAATQLDSTNVLEMEAIERPQELPDDNAVFEMEGDMPGPPLYREKEGLFLR